MYDEYSAHVVYGFSEPSTSFLLDEDYVASTLHLDVYASEVVRGHMCTPVYGIRARLHADGTIVIRPEDKEVVDRAYTLVSAQHTYTPPQYQLGLSGDLGVCHYRYTLGDSKRTESDHPPPEEPSPKEPRVKEDE